LDYDLVLIDTGNSAVLVLVVAESPKTGMGQQFRGLSGNLTTP
jgi:hypothetical protein